MEIGNSSSTNAYWLCPLYSFDCYSDTVDLVDGIQIRRVPREFKGYLLKQYSDWWWIDPSETKYMLVLPQNVVAIDKIKSMFDWHVSHLLVDLITAFRLCHTGTVTPGPLVPAKLQNSAFSISQFDDVVSAIIVCGPILTSISKEGADLFAYPQYEFVQSDVLLVSKFVKNLIKLHDKKEPDNLSIALRRFNSSYHGSLENRLIDQMIAFEFLYLGYDQELKYRLALRAAYLLGENDETIRIVIFNKMRRAYQLRNDIVHGNKQVNIVELEQVIPETEEYLRQSIRRLSQLLIRDPRLSLKQLREGTDKTLPKLEENILSNGTLLSSKE